MFLGIHKLEQLLNWNERNWFPVSRYCLQKWMARDSGSFWNGDRQPCAWTGRFTVLFIAIDQADTIMKLIYRHIFYLIIKVLKKQTAQVFGKPGQSWFGSFLNVGPFQSKPQNWSHIRHRSPISQMTSMEGSIHILPPIPVLFMNEKAAEKLHSTFSYPSYPTMGKLRSLDWEVLL